MTVSATVSASDRYAYRLSQSVLLYKQQNKALIAENATQGKSLLDAARRVGELTKVLKQLQRTTKADWTMSQEERVKQALAKCTDPEKVLVTKNSIGSGHYIDIDGQNLGGMPNDEDAGEFQAMLRAEVAVKVEDVEPPTEPVDLTPGDDDGTGLGDEASDSDEEETDDETTDEAPA